MTAAIFDRRGGPVDRERRAGVSCFRDHHCGEFEADADGPGSGRVRSGFSRVDRRAHSDDSGDDDQWPLKLRGRPKLDCPSTGTNAAVVLLGGGDVRITWNDPKPAAADLPLTPEAKGLHSTPETERCGDEGERSYFKQVVVEIDGKIGNSGDRDLSVVEICVFYGVRPIGAAQAIGNRQRTDGRAEAGRNQIVPPAVRRDSRELESRHAATGDRRNQI